MLGQTLGLILHIWLIEGWNLRQLLDSSPLVLSDPPDVLISGLELELLLQDLLLHFSLALRVIP